MYLFSLFFFTFLLLGFLFVCGFFLFVFIASLWVFCEFVCLVFGAVLNFSDQILFGMRGFKLKNNSSLTFCSSYLDCKRFPPYIFLWRSKQTNICGSTFCASSGWALLDDYVCISRSSARLSGSLQAIHTGALGGVFKEGELCCLWRKREGSDEKLLLDVSFWIAWRVFQLVERQPTPGITKQRILQWETAQDVSRGAPRCSQQQELSSQRVSKPVLWSHAAFAHWKPTGPESSSTVTSQCHISQQNLWEGSRNGVESCSNRALGTGTAH